MFTITYEGKYVPFAEYVQWSVAVSVAHRVRGVERQHHFHDAMHVTVGVGQGDVM